MAGFSIKFPFQRCTTSPHLNQLKWNAITWRIDVLTAEIWKFGNFQNFQIFKISFIEIRRGWARTQTPTTRNCTVELPTFAVIAGVSSISVQWKSLALEETRLWSDLLPRQVSMLFWANEEDQTFKTFQNLVDSELVQFTIHKLAGQVQVDARIHGFKAIASRPNG